MQTWSRLQFMTQRMIDGPQIVGVAIFESRLLLRRKAFALLLAVLFLAGLTVGRGNFVDYGRLLASYNTVHSAVHSDAEAVRIGGDVVGAEQAERVLSAYERQLSERSAVLDSSRSWRVSLSLFGSLALFVSLACGALLAGWDRRPGFGFFSISINRGRKGLFLARTIVSVGLASLFALGGCLAYQLLAWRYQGLYPPFGQNAHALQQLDAASHSYWMIIAGMLVGCAILSSLGMLGGILARGPAVGIGAVMGVLLIDHVMRQGYAWYNPNALGRGLTAMLDPSSVVTSAMTASLWPFNAGAGSALESNLIVSLAWLVPMAALGVYLFRRSDLQAA